MFFENRLHLAYEIYFGERRQREQQQRQTHSLYFA